MNIKNKLNKLRTDFLAHRFETVLDNFPNCIEELEKEKNSDIRNYRKLFVYSIVHLG